MAKAKSESGNCVLTLPLITEPWQEHIIETRFAIMEHLKNALIKRYLKRLNNLRRTREYRAVMDVIFDKKIPYEQKKEYYARRNQMYRDIGIPSGSKHAFEKDIQEFQSQYWQHIGVQVAHKASIDVYDAFSKLLYGNAGGYADSVHYHRKNSLESIASKSCGNCMDYRDGLFIWSGGNEPKSAKQKRLEKFPKSKTPHGVSLTVKVTPPRNEYEREMLRKPIK